MPSFRNIYSPRREYQPNTSIQEMIMRSGSRAADARRQEGHIKAGMIQNLGNIAGGTLRDIAERRAQERALESQELAEAPRRADEARLRGLNIQAKQGEIDAQARETMAAEELSRLFSGDTLPTQVQIIKAMPYDPERGLAISRGLDALQPDKAKKYKDQSELLRDALFGVAAVPEPMRPEAYNLARTNLLGRGLIDETMAPEEYTPETFAQLMNFGNEPQAPVKPGKDSWIAERVASGVDAATATKQWNERTAVATSGASPSFQPKAMRNADGKEIITNYDSKTGKYYDVDTGALLKDLGSPPTADMKNKAEGRKLVKSSINSIKEIGDNIIVKIGPSQRADAIKRGVEAVFGTDPEFRTYEDARVALAGNLAVAQQGSRPSDADIKSVWLPLVPSPYRDTKESAKMKWDLIRKMSNVATEGDNGPVVPRKPEETLIEYLIRTGG